VSSEAVPPLPGWVAAVNATSRAFGVFAAGLIVLGVFVICHMVFVRAVLGESSIWQTEFTTFSLIAATFLGAPYILLTRGHVAVDVLPLMLATPARRRLHLLGSAVMAVFVALMLWASLPWWQETWDAGQTTSSMWRARLWIPYLAVPVGLALLLAQIAADAWCVATRRSQPFGLGDEETL
jgi:TRAP-type C4-dicarboxylate transport system permease small subunit